MQMHTDADCMPIGAPVTELPWGEGEEGGLQGQRCGGLCLRLKCQNLYFTTNYGTGLYISCHWA